MVTQTDAENDVQKVHFEDIQFLTKQFVWGPFNFMAFATRLYIYITGDKL